MYITIAYYTHYNIVLTYKIVGKLFLSCIVI